MTSGRVDLPGDAARRADGAGPLAPPPHGRAGRALGQAVAVGVVLAALLLGSLYVQRQLFLLLAAAALVVAVVELAGALARAGRPVPVVPLAAASPVLLGAAALGGPDLLLGATAVLVGVVVLPAVLAARAAAPTSATSALLVLVWVPFLAAFTALLLAPDDGASLWRPPDSTPTA